MRVLSSIAQVDAASWNALVGDGTPFLCHEFLLAMEESGCAVPRNGWTARHLVVDDAHGRPAGALPLFLKGHSRGEFVFDFSWANAYAQHGLPYYPKLLSAVPFTPVRGPRLLIAPDADAKAMTRLLIANAMDYARSERLSSWHVLFPTDEAAEALKSAGLILRRDCQFHWYNQGYDSFDAFLATFTAEKRKKAKRERRRVAEAGIEFDTLHGGDMDDALWDAVYPFYADTFYRHGHEPYLNLDFFKRIAASMPDRLMLKMARIGSEPIAVAIFFVGSDALFGRYWGAGGNFHSLHFETCYYQGIEYCIEKKLQRFEPGTQGEHKVPRGFVPTLMSSAHFVADPRFATAIRDFAAREARSVDRYAAEVQSHVPYHRVPDEELQL
ncbi:MAG TPA: GNAT family N-acetyltransferase [Steroidobacteraceae bacterium]|nr:GNAT family N-acetyltransferase [Steroidobacteraceae bacterium]